MNPPSVNANPIMLPTQSWNRTRLDLPAYRPTTTEELIRTKLPTTTATMAAPIARNRRLVARGIIEARHVTASAGARAEHDGVSVTQNEAWWYGTTRIDVSSTVGRPRKPRFLKMFAVVIVSQRLTGYWIRT